MTSNFFIMQYAITMLREEAYSMRGPVGSQFLMAVAYLSSRGPSYRFSTLYFWALSGEGRCQIIISSSASEAGSHACTSQSMLMTVVE